MRRVAPRNSLTSSRPCLKVSSRSWRYAVQPWAAGTNGANRTLALAWVRVTGIPSPPVCLGGIGACRLLLGQFEEVAAGDHLSVGLGQRVDCVEQFAAALGVEEGRLGRRSRAARTSLLGCPQRKRPAPQRHAPAVASLVGDDRKQP